MKKSINTKTTKTLVIVESPSKCRKIEEYLGEGYKCVASFGHLRTIASLKDIDIDNGFIPTYSIVTNAYKPKQVETLRAEIDAADTVILACDADREGEAIAFSICEMFGLDPKTTDRIVFREITETALQYAVQHPSRIDMNVVKAQQARQILDLLVGFTVTPFLWKHISRTYENGMSAGRCQTPALRLIYDNYIENKRLSTDTSQQYCITGFMTNQTIPFKLGCRINEESDLLDFLNDTKEHIHLFSRTSPPALLIKKAPTPFITSTIQQMASNELHYSPKETMKCCQELYESGYITYMRTDCETFSAEFIAIMNEYITVNYGSEFVSLKSSISGTGAHEAIRPTSILTKKADTVSIKSGKVYALIWRRTVESCMSDARYTSIDAEITAPISVYKYTSEQIVFAGWKKVVKDKSNETCYYSYLMSLKEGGVIPFKRITADIVMKTHPNHFTEAYLVQMLEKHGIGRPSTFSSICDKNQERKYVVVENIEGVKVECREYLLESTDMTVKQTVKERYFGAEKNKLIIQPTGVLVIEFLLSHFDELFQYTYTDMLERRLDLIASGQANLVDVCSQCYAEITRLGVLLPKETKYSVSIDEHHEYIIGKNGPVVKHTADDGTVSFKPAKKDIDISTLSSKTLLDDVLEKITHIKLGLYQDEDLVIRRGKFGTYVTWGISSKSMPEFGNRPIENITFAEVFKILEKDGVMNPKVSVGFVREVSANLSIRNGKYGDYIFYKTKQMKTPTFLKLKGFADNYKNCEKNALKLWIKETYKVE